MKEPEPTATRPATQAGRFYEADPQRLRRQLEGLLAESPVPARACASLVLVAPHAGYAYSGAVAAAAYRTLAGAPVDHVLILGPSHYADFGGAALPSQAAFATPLGAVAIDREAVNALAAGPGFAIREEGHAREHSIEVQLPFLQIALAGPFQIVPVTLGRLPAEGLEPLVETLGGLLKSRRGAGEHWLIVVSTDTYHGFDAQACRANDERLRGMMEGLDSAGLLEAFRRREVTACGWLGLVLALRVAEALGARRGEVLQRADSQGPERGAGDYVVGYLAAAIS